MEETVSVESRLSLCVVVVRSDVERDLNPRHLAKLGFAFDLDDGCLSPVIFLCLGWDSGARKASDKACSLASATSSVEGLKLTLRGDMVLDARREEASAEQDNAERLGRSSLGGASCWLAASCLDSWAVDVGAACVLLVEEVRASEVIVGAVLSEPSEVTDSVFSGPAVSCLSVGPDVAVFRGEEMNGMRMTSKLNLFLARLGAFVLAG